MPSYIEFTDEQLSKMKEMYESGKNTTQISEKFGICRIAVTLRLRRMGVLIRKVGKAGKITPSVVERVKSLRALNVSWKEIEREIKLSENYLQKILKREKDLQK